jgi:hypothetical protein
MKDGQKALRFERSTRASAQLAHGVEEGWLVLNLTDGIALVHARHGHDLELRARGQGGHRAPQRPQAVAEVGPETHEDAGGGGLWHGREF